MDNIRALHAGVKHSLAFISGPELCSGEDHLLVPALGALLSHPGTLRLGVLVILLTRNHHTVLIERPRATLNAHSLLLKVCEGYFIRIENGIGLIRLLRESKEGGERRPLHGWE